MRKRGEARLRRRRLFRELAVTCLDCLVAPTCPGCGVVASGWCRTCRFGLAEIAAGGCPRCGLEVGGDDGCDGDHRLLQGIDAARAAWRYRDTGGRTVRRFKFEGNATAGHHLAAALAVAIGRLPVGRSRTTGCVVVPTSARTRRRRGRDHAAWLGARAAELAGVPFVRGALVRTRDTLPQADPRVTSRLDNVEGAFAVRRPRAVRGRDLILIDDVITSGATARGCAAVLRAAGAARIWLATATIG